MIQAVKTFVRRLVWKTPNRRFTFFLQFGILHTLMFGLMFTMGSCIPAVDNLKLFEFTNEYLPTLPGNVWGLLLLLVVVGHIAEMQFRGQGIGPWVAMLGFMCWIYAACAYFIVSPISIFMITLWPIAYWIWYYASAVRYKRALDKGLIQPVD